MKIHTEIFENEEAAKLLDYFVAYKKLASKVEYIKCISAINSDVQFKENPLPLPEPEHFVSNLPEINLISELEK